MLMVNSVIFRASRKDMDRVSDREDRLSIIITIDGDLPIPCYEKKVAVFALDRTECRTVIHFYLSHHRLER